MTDPNLRIRQMSLDLSSPNHIPLNARIAEFRQDPQNMDQMTEFVDDVINQAQIEVNKRLDVNNKTETKKSGKALSIIGGIKRGRMVTRAQSLIVRMFEAICNCTSAGPLPNRVASTKSMPETK